MWRSSTTFSIVANAAHKALSQLRRAVSVRCFHKHTYVFFYSNQNRNMLPDISRNSKHRIIKKKKKKKKKTLSGVSHSLYHTDRRRDVTRLMVTFRSFYVKTPRIRFLVTGRFVLGMVQLCFWRDNVYSFVLMGVHHSSTWRHRGTSSYRVWRNRRLLP